MHDNSENLPDDAGEPQSIMRKPPVSSLLLGAGVLVLVVLLMLAW